MLPIELLVPLSIVAPIVFGIAILVALRLIGDRHATPKSDSLHMLLTVVGLVLIALGCLAIFLRTFHVMGLLFWVILAFVLVDAIQHTIASKRLALLGMLTSAAQHEIPMVPAVEAYAQELGGSRGIKAKRLAAMLSSGVALPVALRRCRGLISPDVLPLIQVGHDSGAMAPALRQAASAEDSRRSAWSLLGSSFLYVACIFGFAGLMCAAVLTFIVPSYVAIFNDFEIELPLLTQVLISTSDMGFVFFVPWLIAFAMVFIFVGKTLLQLVAGVRWTLPGEARLTRALHAAAVLDALSLGAENQYPLSKVIAALAWSHPNRWVRRRLKSVLDDIEAGGDWCESLRLRGLLRRADVSVLQAAQRTGNLAWAIQEMARSNRRSFSRRLQALVHVAMPPIVILIGILVRFVVAALFLPLIKLIESLV